MIDGVTQTAKIISCFVGVSHTAQLSSDAMSVVYLELFRRINHANTPSDAYLFRAFVSRCQ